MPARQPAEETMMNRVRIFALAAAATLQVATLSISPVRAKSVRYPAAQPEIALDVPDDWTVAETPLGLELQSPSKDALVIAGLTEGDRKSVDGWSRRALERMDGEGVVFDKSGTAKPTKPHVAGYDVAMPAAASATSPKPSDDKPTAPAAATPSNRESSYTFGGPAMVDPLKSAQEKASKAGAPRAADIPSISTGGFNPAAMKASGHFAYIGGTLHGQPVDVELAVFPLGKDRRVLIEQQSGPTDARGVMIVRSLRSVGAAR